jgi:hypothetical protein
MFFKAITAQGSSEIPAFFKKSQSGRKISQLALLHD